MGLLVDDNKPFAAVLKELSDIEPLNETEAELMLFKLREISVSDIAEFMITCGQCQAMTEYNVEIEEFFDLGETFTVAGEVLPKGYFENIEEIINTNIDLDEIPLKIYNDIESVIKKQNNSIFPIVTRHCRKCNNPIELELDIRTNFSKSTPAGIYQDYVDISIFSHNGKLDIDSMWPFEREIFVSLIKDYQTKLQE